MGLIVTIIVGALAGWLASIIMKRNAQMGAVANIIVGIVGAFIGNLVASFLGWSEIAGNFSIGGVALAVLGAVILLFILDLIKGRR